MSRILSTTMRAAMNRLRELRHVNCVRDLPVDVMALARRMGVQILAPADLSVDGYVGYTHDGKLVIRYQRSHSRLRSRFTIAHEIGHLIIAEITNTPLQTRKTRTGFDPEELLANRLAAEILMPESILGQYLRSAMPSWGAIQDLRKMFEVSAYALLRRTTEIDTIAAIFAKFDVENQIVRRWGFCQGTTDPQLSFDMPFRDYVEGAIRSICPDRFTVPARVNCSSIELPCQVRIAKHGCQEDSWVYGWTSV